METGESDMQVIAARLRVRELEELLSRLRRGLNGTGALLRKQNDLRREEGKLWMAVRELNGERMPTLGRDYRDSYPAVTLVRGSRGRNRRIRVFDWDGEILDGSGILVLEPRLSDRFWKMGADLWVEPHPGWPGSWKLVGEYNFRDQRIG